MISRMLDWDLSQRSHIVDRVRLLKSPSGLQNYIRWGGGVSGSNKERNASGNDDIQQVISSGWTALVIILSIYRMASPLTDLLDYY
jgi:hypothetical protein